MEVEGEQGGRLEPDLVVGAGVINSLMPRSAPDRAKAGRPAVMTGQRGHWWGGGWRESRRSVCVWGGGERGTHSLSSCKHGGRERGLGLAGTDGWMAAVVPGR